ncbi:CoA transferase [Marinobacter sp. B9-2]|nr:CoA transferase [Marinobacter sp. B9-2]
MSHVNGSQRPLDGVRIISLEHAIAAPFCTRQLAELGARVIKVERPGIGDFARGYDTRVDGLASHFVWTNRSKESLTLDLKQPDAERVLHQLLEGADVLVQNLSPGAARRLGLSFDDLHSEYPELIVCDISGYGVSGPYEVKKAYDLLIQSEGGFLSVTGTEGDDGMAKAGCSIADIAAGMYAYSSILSALLLRAKSGKGSHIEVSMLESLVEWMGYPLYYSYKDAPPPPRAGASHSTIFPYGPFQCGDKKSVMLGLQNEREWQGFCLKVLKKPELLDDPRFAGNELRSEHRVELKAIIELAFEGCSSDEVGERLDNAGIANGHVNEMRDVWNHKQLAARSRWTTVGSPVGELPALLPPGSNSSFRPRLDEVPSLGQHSEDILQEMGYSSREIESLRERRVI